jgi:hypothetical protein
MPSPEAVAAKAWKNVKMEMPHVLVPGRTIVLTRRDALTPKCILHRRCQQTRRAKDVVAESIGNIQHVLVMKPRRDEAVAAYVAVVMKRYESKHVGLDQNHRRFRRRRRQRLSYTAEGALIAMRSVLQGIT